MADLGFVTDRHRHTAGTDRAAFSPNRTHRYALMRRWAPGPTACWIMLNPSTADAFRTDPTVTRCIGFTQRAGSFGGLVIVNLYSLRSTDPAALWTRPDPVGPCGDQFLYGQAGNSALAIAAWGTHGARNGRGQQVAAALDEAGIGLYCLGLTAGGHPKHPLYVKSDTKLEPYTIKAVAHV